MSATAFMKFYPTDWRGDQALRVCSLAARGLWIEMLCVMHNATPYGHLLINGRPVTDTQLAMLAGTATDQIPELLGELEAAAVFSRTQKGVIYSRRMTRDHKRANEGRIHVNKRWDAERRNNQPVDNAEENPRPNSPPTSPPTSPPSTPDTRYQKETPYNPPPGDVPGNGRDFDEFWDKYPSRGDAPHSEKAAHSAFDAVVKSGTDPAVLIAAAMAYAAYCRKERVEPRFVKAAAKFLKDGSFRQYGRKPAAPGGAPDRERWRAPLQRFAASGGKTWNMGLGPKPGERGCEAPADLIEEYLGALAT